MLPLGCPAVHPPHSTHPLRTQTGSTPVKGSGNEQGRNCPKFNSPLSNNSLSPSQGHQFALGMMPAGGKGKGEGTCCQQEPWLEHSLTKLEHSLRDSQSQIIMDSPPPTPQVFALKRFSNWTFGGAPFRLTHTSCLSQEKAL